MKLHEFTNNYMGDYEILSKYDFNHCELKYIYDGYNNELLWSFDSIDKMLLEIINLLYKKEIKESTIIRIPEHFINNKFYEIMGENIRLKSKNIYMRCDCSTDNVITFDSRIIECNHKEMCGVTNLLAKNFYLCSNAKEEIEALNQRKCFSYYEEGIVKAVVVFRLFVENDAVSMLEYICVDSSQRRNGIAEKLINYALNSLLKHDIREVVLWVNQENTEALKLYNKLGFKTDTNNSEWCFELLEGDSNE